MSTRTYITLSEFLQEVQHKPTRHVVLGNEAGDADSIISTIGLAYVDQLLSSRQQKKEDQHEILTPVISIPAIDLQTQRPESTLLLRLAGITNAQQQSLLHFIDGPFWTNAQELDLTLVDHNRIASQFHDRKHRVVEILDHHLDESYHLESCTRRTIAYENHTATVASTCTLVVERFQRQHPSLNADNLIFPAPLSVLLLGVILLDAVNLSPSAGKATSRDCAAVQALLEQTNWDQLTVNPEYTDKLNMQTNSKGRSQPDTDALFEALQNSKFDASFWMSLSVVDALRLDYKNYAYNSNTNYYYTSKNGNSMQVSTFGISTVLMPMQLFLQKEDDLILSLQSFMNTRTLDFLAIMLSSEDMNKVFRRQLILCATNTNFMKDMVQYLLQTESRLNLTGGKEFLAENGFIIKCFEQGNASASRKMVAPIMLGYFEKMKQET